MVTTVAIHKEDDSFLIDAKLVIYFTCLLRLHSGRMDYVISLNFSHSMHLGEPCFPPEK